MNGQTRAQDCTRAQFTEVHPRCPLEARLEAVLSQLPDGHRSEREIIQALLLAIQAQDSEVHGHGQRTAQYAVALGTAAGLSGAELIDLDRAALLHDIGRLTLPDAILHKAGPLTAEEYAEVQCHPRTGAELLQPIPFLEAAALLIAHHHERWDGSGYPYGLRGSLIPLGSRILAVADTFDALTSVQPEPAPRSLTIALNQLSVISGTQLDPELVSTFLKMDSAPTIFCAYSPPHD